MPDVFAGMMLWEREHAPEVLRVWAEWTHTAPESVTSSLRVMSFPPMPELPPFLSGRQLVVVDGAVLEDDERAAELIAPLRALAPEMDTFARIPAPALLGVHMDPPAPTPGVSAHTVLGELTDEAMAAYLDQVGPGTTTPLLSAELRQLGGAFARRADGGGAISSVAGDYALICVAVAPVPEAAAAGLAAGAAMVEAMAPWSEPSRVQTFSEEPAAASSFFDAESWERIRRVRDGYDPGRLFLAGHEI
jgi:hypothetical protein